MRLLLKISLISIIFTSFSSATIINVPADQSTIQDGIDAATDGDTVLVQPGTYGENINFDGKNIVVGSLFLTTGDASYISNTLITGADYKVYRVVYFAGGEDSTAVLNGFTITKDSTYFGAIECNAGSGPTLMNLILSGNKALVDFAGGITCKNGSSPTLVNITIRGSSGTFGGGISCMNSRMKLINVTISDDSASIMGGGILCWDSEMTLVNVTIVGNKCSSNHVRGGGIECRGSESEMILVNTIVWNNSSPEIYISYSDSDLVEAFNCDIKGGWDGFGNINADPMFVDAANGDYRLQEGSPCIDVGTDFFVWQGDTILNLQPSEYYGDAPDIGAYEFGDPSAIEREIIITPTNYLLRQNYPNPFNPSTTIEFTLPSSEFVILKVYNILGEEITTLVSKKIQAGNHTYQFDGSNLSSGVYTYRIEAGEFQQVRKMVMIK